MILKKINFAKLVWISAIFLELIVILVMVMDYKINYQNKKNNQIYFYEHEGLLNVTEVSNDDYLMYSTYDCGYKECPTLKSELGDSHVILVENGNNILFDYRKGKVISSGYDDYKVLSNGYVIVVKNELQGLINSDNKVTVSIKYSELGYKGIDTMLGYNLNYILVRDKDKYGIVSIKNGSIAEPIEHNVIELEDLLRMMSNGDFAD